MNSTFTAKVLPIFLLLTLLVVTAPASSATYFTPLQFNLKQCVYQTNRQWTSIKLGVSGGTSPYTYYYDEYPQGWKHLKQEIVIPKQSLNKNMKYPCKIKIADKNGAQTKATIVFLILKGKVTVSQALYQYDKTFDDNFYNSGQYKGKPKMVKGGSYYKDRDDLVDLKKFDFYMSKDELSEYQKKADILKQCDISKTSGTGLNPFYDYLTVNQKSATFSLIDALNSIQKNTLVNSNTFNQNIFNITPVNANTVFKNITPAAYAPPQIPTIGYPSPILNPASFNMNVPSTGGIAGFLNGFFNNIFGNGASAPALDIKTSFDIPSASSTISISQFINNSKNAVNPTVNVVVNNKTIINSTTIVKNTTVTNTTTNKTNTTTSGTKSNTATTTPTIPTSPIIPTQPTQPSQPAIQPVKFAINKTADSFYSSLPTSQQIDTLILNSDNLALIKLVQQVATSNLTCEQKSSYLTNYLGRVQSAISMKQFSAQQLQMVIDAATTTYKNITQQITDSKKQIIGLNLQASKDKLNADLTILQGLYSQFNNQDANTTVLSQTIDALKKDIAIQQAKSDVDRQQLIRQKLSYNEADQNVQNIQRLLDQAKQRKAQIQSNITNYKKRINQSEIQIKNIQKNITSLEAEIDNQQAQSDKLKTNYVILETKVQRHRSDIANKTKQQDQYNNKNAILEERINIQRKKLMTNQYDKLKEMVVSLEKSLPGIQSFIDDGYYTCMRLRNITMAMGDKNGNGTEIVYIVGPTDFSSYIETSYTLKPDWKQINLPQNVTLSPLNIMDPSWQAAFGLPYDLVSYASSIDFSFANDFNCLTPSSLQSGYGVISSIFNKQIIMENPDGGQTKLTLGTCTRLQTTQFLPLIGQRIYWRGVPTNNGEFNIYRASCI